MLGVKQQLDAHLLAASTCRTRRALSWENGWSDSDPDSSSCVPSDRKHLQQHNCSTVGPLEALPPCGAARWCRRLGAGCWAAEQLCPSLTFDAGDLLALRLAEEVQLVGDGLQHLDEVGQEEDDVDVVIGEVPPAADALRPLDVGAAQQGHRGPLVHVLRVQPEGRPKGNVSKSQGSPAFVLRDANQQVLYKPSVTSEEEGTHILL